MSGDLPAGLDVVVAYQDTELAELRCLFDQVDFDLRKALVREVAVADQMDHVEAEVAVARAALLASGAVLPAPGPEKADADVDLVMAPTATKREVPSIPHYDSMDELDSLARRRLAELGVRPDRDPLLQVLPRAEVSQALKAYGDRYGETAWTDADWAVVLLAGLVGTLLDMLVVGTPGKSLLLGHAYAGSPLTAWLKDGDLAKALQAQYLSPLEKTAHVPFDATLERDVNGQVLGLRPKVHRLMTYGHDPVLGFLFGVADLMHGTGTYIDKFGRVVTVQTSADHLDLITAFSTELRHLMSDVGTSQGIQPPLFTLLQRVPGRSPFVFRTGGAQVAWTDVARSMYANGYDLRHCFASGVVPGTVTAIITGYALLDAYTDHRAVVGAKVASMLVLGHAIAMSGTLLKTGLLYGMNPAAFNWAELMAMGPVTLAWVGASAQRDRRIRQGLDEEWVRLAAGFGTPERI